MVLNDGQNDALSKGKKWWHKQDKPTFEIAGAAGTGKSTVISALVKELGLKDDEVLYMAFVGKAALLLTMKGLNAKTIHSTIYLRIDVPKLDDNGNEIIVNGKRMFKSIFKLRDKLPENIKLLIVDEASMVNKHLGEDLLSFDIPIIALGDLNQLPPIAGDFFFLRHPDVILTEIMRQQEGNPIIHISKLAREGKTIEFGNYGNKVLVIKKQDMLDKFYETFDITICAKNKTRDALNHYIRSNIYHIESEIPIIGDKVICRQNNWNECICNNIFLINGMLGYINNINWETFNKQSVEIDFRPEFLENYYFPNITIDYPFLQMDYLLKKNYMTHYNKFEYGYAITGHLSQGSQYNKVIVFDERMGDEAFYRKWLYTVVTRAIDKLIIVR